METVMQKVVRQLSPYRWLVVVILLISFAVFLKFFPFWFIGFTILATLLVMYRCEERIALHQRILYTSRPPTKNTKRRILGIALVKGLRIGVIAGILPAIAVAGATSGADALVAALFMACVIVATGVLFYLREKREIRPLQFGLVKMAFPAGLGYALIQMLRPSLKGGEIRDKAWDTFEASMKRDFEVEEVFKTLNSFLTLVDGALQ